MFQSHHLATVLKNAFGKHDGDPVTPDYFIKECAKNVLLSTDECSIWLEQLETVLKNRQRGALKAAATRQKKKECLCGTCGKDYFMSTEEELWVGCDLCLKYCSVCEKISAEPQSETFLYSLY